MDKRQNEIEFLINKYIGTDKKVCSIPIYTTFYGRLSESYLLFMEPNGSFCLMDDIAFYRQHTVKKINAKEIINMRIKTDYYPITLFAFFCTLWPVVFLFSYFPQEKHLYIISFLIFFTIFFLLSIILPSRLLYIKTYNKNYKFHYADFIFFKKQSLQNLKLSHYVQQFSNNNKL